jgi:L-glyceraldehyde 3-phosphate reductase
VGAPLGEREELAQMAVAWTLRHAGMTSVVMGASRVEQVEQNVAALAKLGFTPDELARIDALTA